METIVQNELQEKLEKLISQKQPKAIEQIAKIRRDADNLEDFVAPIGKKSHLQSPISFSSNGTVKAEIQIAGEIEKYGIHNHAVGQFGEKLGIPTRYLRDLAASPEQWARDLAAHSLNESAVNSGRSRLLIRSIEGEIRGVLSDSYRRLDTSRILAQFLNAVDSAGATIFDAAYTETKSFVEVILPRGFQIQTEKNGNVDLVFGMQISNSDFGDGSLKVSSFLVNGACWNGMLFKSSLNQIHLGRRLPDDLRLSEETYRKDTDAQASAVRDITGQLLTKDRILELAGKIKGAASQEIDNVENEIRRLSRLGGGMNKGELALVEERLKLNRAGDGLQGELTRWKLSNAVTAVARDNEDQRRKRELEEIGAALLDL